MMTSYEEPASHRSDAQVGCQEHTCHAALIFSRFLFGWWGVVSPSLYLYYIWYISYLT